MEQIFRRVPHKWIGVLALGLPTNAARERRGENDGPTANHGLGARDVPDSRCVVGRRDHHALAVGAEGRAQYALLMGLQERARGVPDPKTRSPRLPSGLKAAPNALSSCAFRTAISVPVSASQIRAVRSVDAVTAYSPQGLKAAMHDRADFRMEAHGE